MKNKICITFDQFHGNDLLNSKTTSTLIMRIIIIHKQNTLAVMKIIIHKQNK